MTVEQYLNLIQIIKSENLIFTIITLKQEQMKRKLCLTSLLKHLCPIFNSSCCYHTYTLTKSSLFGTQEITCAENFTCTLPDHNKQPV